MGAISLDLVAVLLGGATALLPAFARDVLKAGPEGFGILRVGPAVGATVVGLWLAWRPIRRKAGVIMLVGRRRLRRRHRGVRLFPLALAFRRSPWRSSARRTC